MSKAVSLLLVLLAAGATKGFREGREGEPPSPVIMHPDTGSDAWGYTWFRSDEPGGPTFRWVDITTRGTLVPNYPTPGGLGDDNVAGPFNLLFNFQYYWYTVDRFKIGSNGYITFDMTSAAFAPPFAALPSTSLPEDLLA